MTTMEQGLTRLLRLCPDIILTSDDIQKMIDGKTNDVISKWRNVDVVLNEVITSTQTTDELIVAESTFVDIDEDFDDDEYTYSS